MDKEEVTQKYRLAQELVGGIDKSFQDRALEIVFRRLLEEGEVPVAPPPARIDISKTLPRHLSELLKSKSPKSHPERVLAIACFYLRTKNEPVTRAEILNEYTNVHLPRPKNMSDVIAQCVRKAWLVSHPDRKEGQNAWFVTPTGEAYFDQLE